MAKVAFDTETKGLDWWNPEQQAFLGSWADADGEYVADLSDGAEVGRFLDALRSADTLVCHNLPFDTHQTRETCGLDILTTGAETHDTALMANVMFQSREKGANGLKNLAKTHLDPTAGDAEAKLLEYAEAAGIKMKDPGGYYDMWRAYKDAMELYAKLDARYTYDLSEKFMAEMDEKDMAVYRLEQESQPVLVRAEQLGVATDQEVVTKLHHEYTLEEEKLHELVAQTLGEDALGGEGSEEALITALQDLGINLHRRTESGKLAVNQYALAEFENDFPVVSDLFELRRVRKFLSTYLGPMLGNDVLHTSFRQMGAWTGRMSSARPNMQNVPKRAGKEVRAALVPRPGCAFVVYDYEGIEIRLLAYYLADQGFRDLIAHGHDPHAWMAAQIHGGEMEYYVKGAEGESLRGGAKNTLFAITYGAGKGKVSDMNGLNPEPYYGPDHPAVLDAKAKGRFWPKEGYQYAEAAALIKKIKSSLPNYYRLNKRVKAKVESEGYVSTVFGRRNYVNKDKSYVGLNALIQGSAADIMKLGLIAVDNAVRPYGATPVLVVHDEVVVETPIENAERVAELTKEALESAWPLDPPLSVEGSIVTTNYSEA